MISQQQIEAFMEACHRAGRYGLVRYSSGNMSWRLDETYYAVTAKGSWLGELRPEMPVYIGPPAIVDYHKPGSPELTRGVVEALKHANMALLRNHGLVTLGRDFDETLQRAGFFELICEILLSGVKTHTLPPEAVQELRSGVA